MDTRLPFGGRRSPEIFHRLTQVVRRIMAKKGYHALVVYLDDFLIIGESKEACQAAFDALSALPQNFGFSISWHKVVQILHNVWYSFTLCLTQLRVPCHHLQRNLRPYMNFCWSFLCTEGLLRGSCRCWLANLSEHARSFMVAELF